MKQSISYRIRILCAALFPLYVPSTIKKFLIYIYFCNVIYVIFIDMTEGGTLSKPILAFLMQVGVWTSTSSERFIDCSLQVLCPALDSLFDVDCYSGAAALQRHQVSVLQWSDVTALFISEDHLVPIIYYTA